MTVQSASTPGIASEVRLYGILSDPCYGLLAGCQKSRYCLSSLGTREVLISVVRSQRTILTLDAEKALWLKEKKSEQ